MKPTMRSYTWLTFLTVVLALGMACSKVAGDSDVTGEIQSKINADSGLQGKQLTVQTSNGVVTLSGTVDNDTQRTAASRYASSVAGVKQVINDLQVVPAMAAAIPDEPAAPTPARPVRAAEKPRPSTPRTRPAPKHSEMAAATPPPQMEPAQESHPAPAAAPAPPPPPPPVKKVTIPTGTTLAVRLVDPIDSETSQPGQTFKATLDTPLSVDGDIVLPAGYDVQGHIVDVKSAGKFAGKSELVLQLDRILVSGRSYSIQSDQYKREGNSRGKNTAEKVGAGAAIGAIIGGLAGGGKGAGIGAAAGGGLGGGVQAATKGQQIRLPSETVINFSLQSSLTVTPAEGRNSERHKLETPAPASTSTPDSTPAPPSAQENLGPQQ